MADDTQLKVSIILPPAEAFQLMQYAMQQFNVVFDQDIQIQNITQYKNKLIFMSYRRSDSRDICGRIYDYLIQEFNKDNIFRDIESILAGLDFSDDIIQNAESCTLMLAIIGPTWLDILQQRLADADQIDYVRLEIGTALKRNTPVIPVYVNDAPLLNDIDLPEDLKNIASRNAVIIRPDPHFRSDVGELIRQIQQLFELIDNPNN